MSDHLTPLEVCEWLVAPLAELERIAGYKPKAAYGWRRSGLPGRKAGDLPPNVGRKILTHAVNQRLPLTAQHLVSGASVNEVVELLETVGDDATAQKLRLKYKKRSGKASVRLAGLAS